MPKEAKRKEVRDRMERLNPDDLKERLLLSLNEMMLDEFSQLVEKVSELSAKAREKYGNGIQDAAFEILTEAPRLSEEEFWRRLEEYWNGLDEAARRRSREQKPPPASGCLTGALTFKHPEGE